MPEDATLFATLGSGPRPPQAPSTVEPYQEVVQRLVDQGVEMTAIFQRLRDNHGYTGSYSAVRRAKRVRRLYPATPEAVVRVHTAPGEELQVDPSAGSGQAFGSVGQLYDPDRGRPWPACAFVATLGFSRHQYAELVFDQKTPTWIGLHRRAFESFGGTPQRVAPDRFASNRRCCRRWSRSVTRCWAKPTAAWDCTMAS